MWAARTAISSEESFQEDDKNSVLHPDERVRPKKIIYINDNQMKSTMGNYDKAAMDQLNALGTIYNKLAKAMKLRMTLHSRREAALLIITPKLGAISNLKGDEHDRALRAILIQSEKESQAISTLRQVLHHETLAFSLIGKEEGGAEQAILLSIKELKSQKRQIREAFGKELTLKDGRKIRVGDIQKFLHKVQQFLSNLRGDLGNMLKRMQRERGFLERFAKNQDVSDFDKFLRQWGQEVKAFGRMQRDLGKVMESIPQFAAEGARKLKIEPGRYLEAAAIPLVGLWAEATMAHAPGPPGGLNTLPMFAISVALCFAFLAAAFIEALQKSMLSGVDVLDRDQEGRLVGAAERASR